VSKRLLATSDDFGMCQAVNEGIVLAMTQGWCRSTNYLAPAPWFREAVDLARRHRLEVGVHLCLTCDWDRLTWGPLTGNPRLRTAEGSLPALHAGLEALGATDEDFYDELKAQIALVRRLHGEPTHVETHMIGGRWTGGVVDRVLKVVVALARQEGLAYTYERGADGALRHFRAERCQSGWSREELLRRLDAWTEDGDYHLFGHAAVASGELAGICSPGHPSREWAADLRIKDLALYLDESLPAAMAQRGFELAAGPKALGL
jgi:predicted glycoside hydrolase/deacetylase ChbG (UPF0249 family)